MGLTLTEKILSHAVGRTVNPGEIIVTEVDLVYAHDGTAPLAIQVLSNELRFIKVFDPGKVVFVIDHAAPSPSINVSKVHKLMRDFSYSFRVKLYDVGNGICHQLIPEEGLVKPGMIIVGADSHTVTLGAFAAFAIGVGSTDAAIAIAYGKIWLKIPEIVKIAIEGNLPRGVYSKDIILYMLKTIKSDGMTYKSVEFHGKTLQKLSMDARMTLTNMCTEIGAKAALIPVDAVTKQWFEERGIYNIKELRPDTNAEYSDELLFDISNLEPQIALPPNVDNVKSISEVEGLEIDQVFIGSCTNGRYEDLLVVAKILNKHKVNPRVRCIIIPASRNIYLKALRHDIIEKLLQAGCVIGPPTCGPCIGAHMGLLAEDEIAISTSNRNFIGRMGHKRSKVYLASPATAAASAIEGKITDPRKYIS